jgi:hypothetical protein
MEKIGHLTQDDIIDFATGLPGVAAVTADEASGAPEVAWGDSFFFYDPDDDPERNRQLPFATIVTKDYDGFDTTSDLNRPGVFRVNVAADRAAFAELIGHPPAEHAEHAGRFDYTAVDRLIPNPVYAHQAWVSVLNPGPRTAALTRSLLAAAHARAVRRHRRRRGG